MWRPQMASKKDKEPEVKAEAPEQEAQVAAKEPTPFIGIDMAKEGSERTVSQMAPQPPDESRNRELTEEEINMMAEQMGVPREQLAGRIIKMAPEFIEQMKEGKVKFQKREVAPGTAQDTQATAQPMQPAPAPQGFRPPSPRQQIESRYKGVLQRAMAMRRTANLPAAVTGRPLTAEAAADIAPEDNDQKPSLSSFVEMSKRKIGNPPQNRPSLAIRPAGAPSILQECKIPVKLFISQHQSPGDILMLSRAIDDLHRSYPGKFITHMRTPAGDIWKNNPNNTLIEEDDPDAMWLQAEYKLINTANRGSHHFSHAFRKELESKLGLPIDQTQPCGAIYLSDQEKSWYSQVWEISGKNVPFWLIDAGRKSDYTAKFWEFNRFQELIDRTPEITWVQIGADTDKKNPHVHPPLVGDNVINLVGKTTIRQLIRLVYHAAGIVTPVSFPMHLAAAVEMHPRYRRRTRPCVVIAGGREPAMWEAYSTQQFLHTCGMLPCCTHGGCWKSRVMPLGDGDDKDYNDVREDAKGNKSIITRLCEMPVVTDSGQIIPKCMDMITTDMVVSAVKGYNTEFDYSDDDDLKWSSNWPYTKPVEVQEIIDDIIEKTEKGEITRKNSVTNSAAQPENTQMPETPKPEAAEQEHAPETEKTEEEPESAETPEAENGEMRNENRGVQPGGGVPPAGEVLEQGEETGVQGEEALRNTEDEVGPDDSPEPTTEEKGE
jgi:ADP-heptose:LPS heptosyltransferase